jgi:hypothetical protein
MKQKSFILIGMIIVLFVQFSGSQTWSVSKRLTWDPADSSSPSVVVDYSDRIHVVWEDYAPGHGEIYYKRSTNGGGNWSWAKRLTWNSGLSIWPKIAVDSFSDLHLVWEDTSPGNYEIFYKKGTQ